MDQVTTTPEATVDTILDANVSEMLCGDFDAGGAWEI